jgi:hypothetical protein
MFLFVHIEKCGGTTFSDMLSLTYPLYFRITKNPYGGNDIRNDITLEQYRQFKRYYPSGIGGHCVRPYLFDEIKSKTFLTFFRNPLDRYLSHMNHNIEGGWSKSFSEFVQKDYYSNFMTKKIAGDNDVTKAKKYLETFDFIGDVGQYNKSINALQDILNVKFYGDEITKNERKNNENYISFNDLTVSEKLIVEERNANDILIYEKYILNTTILNNYSDIIELKRPSILRSKFIKKINKFKKENIINPIRSQN